MSRPFARLLSATALAALPAAAAALDQDVRTEEVAANVATFADGLDHPWALAFLPDGSMLVTERPGRLRRVSAAGEISDPIAGVPKVDARGQGGLLDVALDPDFETNRLVYLSYAEPGEGGTTSTAVARGRLDRDATALADVTVVFSQKPKVASTAHYGSRLAFDDAGRLYVTLGERFAERFRGQAQELDSHLGKIVRINPDGSVPDDNPFVGREGALPEIWSYGHRNVQAAAIHPGSGALWEIEHGPRGGDELNIPKAGGNYGWPVVSYGVNYDGSPVGTGRQRAPGMEDPIRTWTPVIAPSGMAFYSGKAFPEWEGDLFVGGLASTALVRLALDGRMVTHEERLLEDAGQRIRDVAEAPGGEIYVVTDEDDGAILRIAPLRD
ncbi:PQQ-dependent sugar dehydrogenase [Propylenella binzhouense]|uniref:PQQ-dependent sugar dehydrogenase n=1 Tax=Propylenella binzhouense TaxID=2555902 RepID=A0A964T5X0_9HYPH|nr:PQQ-dependent sugar dehydrogenase [Propylenella binzhouense]MYZ48730.1 PQQ-dependent sugar dehydrogenase [Propylenella binzhouense]